jgi:hypothetical protein
VRVIVNFGGSLKKWRIFLKVDYFAGYDPMLNRAVLKCFAGGCVVVLCIETLAVSRGGSECRVSSVLLE